MSEKPFISFIITNFKGTSWLKPCIDSILKNEYKNYEIIIIDVKTLESELNIIQTQYPMVRIIHFEKDPGAAEEHNIGAKTASKKAKYFLFMDNDAEVEKTTVTRLVEYMEENPQCGCSQGEVNVAGVEWFRAILNIMRTNFSNKKPSQVPYVYGCCFLVRKDAYFNINGYDKHFFIYGDDADFSYRIWLANYQIMYVPGIRMIHKGSATVTMSPKIQYHITKNYLTMIYKNLKFPSVLITYPIIFVLNLITALKEMLGSKRKMGLAKIYALFYLIINRRLLIQKRVQIQQYLRKVPSTIIDSYIFSPKKTINNIAVKLIGREY